MRGRLLALLSAASVCSASGCYLAHERAGADASGVDASRIDAGRVDAGPADAGRCDTTKLRTSGLVEPWARGSRCDFLVVCADTSEAIELARASYPGLACRDAPEPACGGLGRSGCTAHVGTLSDAEYDAACALTRRSDVASLVCSGDL